jgi:hypothetical protein
MKLGLNWFQKAEGRLNRVKKWSALRANKQLVIV